MTFLRRLLLASALSMLFVGIASAEPIDFQLDRIDAVGGLLIVEQIYDPPLPLAGSGDIDFGTGTGTLSLPNYSVTIDVSADGSPDALLDITGWTQTITSIDGQGNIVSTGSGSVVCTIVPGSAYGGFVCPGVSPTVLGWPPAGTGSSAILDDVAQTITITDASAASTAGTLTQEFSYTVPEPSSGLTISAALFTLGLVARRRRA